MRSIITGGRKPEMRVEVLVDDADYDTLSKYSWQLLVNPRHPKRYAHGVVDGRYVYMHRFIVQAAVDVDVDHINANGLDNRRTNLRTCTGHQNSYHFCKPYVSNTTGLHGVHKHKGGWRAKISHAGRVYRWYLADAVDAARTYDAAALLLRDADFMTTNVGLGILPPPTPEEEEAAFRLVSARLR